MDNQQNNNALDFGVNATVDPQTLILLMLVIIIAGLAIVFVAKLA